ncbi:MAG: hypothetical protein C0171_02385, partial [Caldisphaera sp.]
LIAIDFDFGESISPEIIDGYIIACIQLPSNPYKNLSIKRLLSVSFNKTILLINIYISNPLKFLSL